jgi:hypothetical protein
MTSVAVRLAAPSHGAAIIPELPCSLPRRWLDVLCVAIQSLLQCAGKRGALRTILHSDGTWNKTHSDVAPGIGLDFDQLTSIWEMPEGMLLVHSELHVASLFICVA